MAHVAARRKRSSQLVANRKRITSHKRKGPAPSQQGLFRPHFPLTGEAEDATNQELPGLRTLFDRVEYALRSLTITLP